MCSGYSKKNADVCIPETPPPPHVCKRLQLGTPSPPKNCGRPLWTAPNQDLKPDKAWFTQRGSEYITTFKKSF